MFRWLINNQVWLSRKFDKVLPYKFRVDGNYDFQENIVPACLKENMVVYDVGAGKRPLLNSKVKEQLNLRVVGLDIEQEELEAAPSGSYDEKIEADIAGYRGSIDADLIICQALLEHVRDVESAFQALSSILKPGGLALIFVPNRNALYARINRIIPQSTKATILAALYPKMQSKQGFKAYYNKCTPVEFKALAEQNNLAVINEYYYYNSIYFSFFFPLYLLWRLWVFVFYGIYKEQAAETFTLIVRKY